MPLLTAFRRSPAVWFSPLLFLMIMFFVNVGDRPASEYYPLALTVTGVSQIFLIAPFCAACAAWEAGRIRRAGWFVFPRTRSLLSFLTLIIAPTVTVGMLATVFAVFVQLWMVPSFYIPDLTVLGVAFIVVIGHILLGFGIGVHIRPVIAAPSILLLDYAWLVMPPAMEPLWLRHLTGAWTGCCDVASNLDPRALIAVTVIASGFAIAAFILVRVPLTIPFAALSVVPIILSFSIGIELVNGMGPHPIVARSDDLSCSDGEPQVCLWPEHRDLLPRIQSLAQTADSAWREVGFVGPRRYSEHRGTALPPDVGAIRVHPNFPNFDNRVLLSLAGGSLPPQPECAIDDANSWPGVAATPFLFAWLGNVAGVPLADLQGQLDPSVVETVEAVRTLPEAEQISWVSQNIESMEDCSVTPNLEMPA